MRAGVLILTFMLLGPGVVMAGPEPSPERTWIGLTPLAGVTLPDRDLDRYRWDVSPQATIGLEAMVGHGSLSGGLRFTRWESEQALGIPGGPASPAVAVSTVSGLARYRFAQVWGFETLATGGFGFARHTYSPDVLTLDIQGSPEPVTVRFESVTSPVWSLGLGVRRHLADAVAIGVDLERSSYRLDTRHRVGDEIVQERQTFAHWTLSFGLAWAWRSS